MLRSFDSTAEVETADGPPGVFGLPFPNAVLEGRSNNDEPLLERRRDSTSLPIACAVAHALDYQVLSAGVLDVGLPVSAQRAVFDAHNSSHICTILHCEYLRERRVSASRIHSLELELDAFRLENQKLRADNQSLRTLARPISQPIYLEGLPMRARACRSARPTFASFDDGSAAPDGKTADRVRLVAEHTIALPPGLDLPSCAALSGLAAVMACTSTPTKPGPEIRVSKSTSGFRETLKVLWRVPRFSAQLRSLMGRALVSSAVKLWQSEDVRFMVQVDPAKRMPGSKREKESYQKMVREGPLKAHLQLKVPSAPTGSHEYWVTVGSNTTGPHWHCFHETTIATWHKPQLDWIKELHDDGSLQVCIEFVLSDRSAASAA